MWIHQWFDIVKICQNNRITKQSSPGRFFFVVVVSLVIQPKPRAQVMFLFVCFECHKRFVRNLCELFVYVNKMHLLFIYLELIRQLERWDLDIYSISCSSEKRVLVKMPETDWQPNDIQRKRICSVESIVVCALVLNTKKNVIFVHFIIDLGSNGIGWWHKMICLKLSARFVYRIFWLKQKKINRWHECTEKTLWLVWKMLCTFYLNVCVVFHQTWCDER